MGKIDEFFTVIDNGIEKDKYGEAWKTDVLKRFGLNVLSVDYDETVDYDDDPVVYITIMLDDNTQESEEVRKKIRELKKEMFLEFMKALPNQNPIYRFYRPEELVPGYYEEDNSENLAS